MPLSDTLTAIGERLIEDIEAMTLATPIKGYLWSAGPTGFDSVPAGVVALPTINRTPVDQPEDHLGQLNFPTTFEIVFYFDASETVFSTAQALEVATAFIDQIDADITLGGLVTEAKVVRTEPANVATEPNARALFAYSATVEVLLFLPSPSL